MVCVWDRIATSKAILSDPGGPWGKGGLADVKGGWAAIAKTCMGPVKSRISALSKLHMTTG